MQKRSLEHKFPMWLEREIIVEVSLLDGAASLLCASLKPEQNRLTFLSFNVAVAHPFSETNYSQFL